ncbi:MAG: DUF1254 domain-containing protein [Calothrix sp. MO_167.B12]|nr:DUF1254 domain-containing protein [Calothrix sp. MO_167.B12]
MKQYLTLETDLVKVQAIAKEATIWAYPMVENYQSIYSLAIDRNSPNYKGPMNQIHNVSRVFTPEDTAIITPNSDTPYSYLIMDLRAEPLVVTMPPIDPNRYYSLQLVDLYTFNFDYLGTRVEGNGGGSYLIAGPNWSGENPQGVKRVISSETNLVFSQFRTQLFNPDDLDNVINVQEQYKVQPLSEFVGTQPPQAPPELDYPPISRDTLQENFFEYVNFLLQFCPTHPTEVELRERFKTIGVEPGAVFPPAGVSQDWLNAISAGQEEGMNEIDQVAQETTTSAGLFGTREELDNDYLKRAVAARLGIYGNSDAEAFYPAYQKDSNGKLLDSGQHNYVLRLPDGDLPATAFWSVTMYDGKTRFLIHNPIDRYLINSSMLPELQTDADGGITLYLQHKSPGADKESNWLPAPDGLMFVVMRLYIPEESVLSGDWQAPPIVISD